MIMLVYFCLLKLLLGSTFVGASENWKSVDFVLNSFSLSSQAIDIQEFVDEVLKSEDARLLLSVQSTAPIEISISKCKSNIDNLLLSETSSLPYFDVELTKDFVQKIEGIIKQKTCDSTTNNAGKGIFLHISSFDQNSFGNIRFWMVRRSNFKKPSPANGTFEVSHDQSYTRNIKLAKLESLVEVTVTNDRPENTLEVFVTFCKDKPGVLYTSSNSQSFSFVLKSPMLEKFYDEYSCDGNNQSFFQNSSQPTAALLIRLETTNETTSGTMNVKVDGEVFLHEDHIATYDSGTFEIESNESKTFTINYKPTYENIHILVEVMIGKLEVYLSPCSEIPLDSLYGELGIGSHQIDVDIEKIMDNSTCTLEQISPNKIFLTVKSLYGLKSVLSFWSPGDGINWYNFFLIVFLASILIILLFVIIYFGRRKSGNFNISPLLHSCKSTKY